MNPIKSNILAHFEQRLMERFGLSLTKNEIEKLTSRFLDYEIRPQFLAKSGKTSISIVEIKGVEVAVVFDWEFNVLKTALRKSWVYLNEDGSIHPKPKDRKKPAKLIRAKDKLKSLHAKAGGTKYKGTLIAEVKEQISNI